MADLDIKSLLQQKKAEKLKALEAARPLVPPAWDARSITTKEGHDVEFESNPNFDSENETSDNTASQPQSRSSDPKPLRKDELSLLSPSSTILISIEHDKRRFFRPLAEAIASSSGEQLGKILLCLCVEYPDARAVVESLLANTVNEGIIESSHPLLPRSSNSRIEQSSEKNSATKKAFGNPWLPIALSSKSQREEQRSLIAKSARDDPESLPAVLAAVNPSRKLPSIPRTPISSDSSVVSEKRHREEPADTLIVFSPQKKSKPYFVIPKHSKKDVSLSENEDTIPQSKLPSSCLELLSSNSPSTSERSKPPKSIEALQPLSDSGNKKSVGGEPSDKITCSICHKDIRKGSNLDSHMRGQHKIEGKPYGCSICTKKFAYRDYLERHMRGVHKTEGEPFGCSICPKKFGLRKQLSHHLIFLHTTDLKCNACGLSHQDRETLSEHMRSVHGLQAVEDKKIKDSSTALSPAKEQVHFQEGSI
ncbi:hypothetical protein EAE96_011326 [Botrytis aclada]|nr:hypothetical protein EAE96_011326 [Botrytis aclada]